MIEIGALNYRNQALLRSIELKQDVLAYMEASKTIDTGTTIQARVITRREQILEVLGGSPNDWHSWKWQLKNRVKDSTTLAQILGLSDMQRKKIDRVGKLYRWAISPYYLSLIATDFENSPIYRQAIPDLRELDNRGSLDPMHEELTSPESCITRRYPDRLIINVTNQCAMYCRHCQRRRNIGEIDKHSCPGDLSQAINYIANNSEVRDVLITGGDALLLNNHTLDWILDQLHRIPHVEIKRIGTRVPVTLPQRITPDLCDILRRYPPIYLNTQFNHPLEVTPEAQEACARLVEAGVILGNQSVLLRGINDDPHILRKLNHELLRIRVRPYYIFHPKDVRGTRHWQTSIKEGLQIMESLRGHTSGLAVPSYIVNAPGGLGKIPLMPNYIMDMQKEKAVLRTWEGTIVEIPEF